MKSDRPERAVAAFKTGINCSMAVFSTFAPELGVDEKTALRIASPFGAGMGRMGETCGAVTGAFMVLGLAFKPKDGETAEQRKDRLYGMVQEFSREFSAQNGSIRCREILGCDLSTPEGQREFKERNLIGTTCVKCVRSAAELAGKFFLGEGPAT